MLHAFGWSKLRFGTNVLRHLFGRPARQFAHLIADFDSRAGREGPQAASAWLLKALRCRITVVGVENVPTAGPLLIVANHPGMADTAALFATLPRDNWRVIAAERGFLRSMPNMSQRLIYVDKPDTAEVDTAANIGQMRQIVRHLRSGGTVITFPAGAIEPDPALFAAAHDGLNDWQANLDIFTRLVPELQIVPVAIGGVLSRRARGSWLMRLRSDSAEKDFLAAILQILIPAWRPVHITVAFGRPIPSATAALQTTIHDTMSTLFQLNFPNGQHLA